MRLKFSTFTTVWLSVKNILQLFRSLASNYTINRLRVEVQFEAKTKQFFTRTMTHFVFLLDRKNLQQSPDSLAVFKKCMGRRGKEAKEREKRDEKEEKCTRRKAGRKKSCQHGYF